MRNNLNEIPIFLYCIRCGIIIGILYDLFRIIRRSNHPVLTGIADSLFGICAIAMAGLTFLYCDNGNLRFYSFFGMFLGAAIYQKYPGKLIRTSIAKLHRKVLANKKRNN